MWLHTDLLVVYFQHVDLNVESHRVVYVIVGFTNVGLLCIHLFSCKAAGAFNKLTYLFIYLVSLLT